MHWKHAISPIPVTESFKVHLSSGVIKCTVFIPHQYAADILMWHLCHVCPSVCLSSVTELCWNSCASCKTLFSLSGDSIFLVFFWAQLAQNSKDNPFTGGIKFRVENNCFFLPKITIYLRNSTWMFILYYGAVIGRCRYLLNDVTFDDIEWPWKAGCEGPNFSSCSLHVCSYRLTNSDKIRMLTHEWEGYVCKGSAMPPTCASLPSLLEPLLTPTPILTVWCQ